MRRARATYTFIKRGVSAVMYLAGSLLFQELEAMEECVACLQRASDLARDNKQHFGDDIAAATRIAKRKRWNALG